MTIFEIAHFACYRRDVVVPSLFVNRRVEPVSRRMLYMIREILCCVYFRAAEICCPGVKCFADDPPFDGFPLPECMEEINATMRVYTRLDPSIGQLVTRNFIP